MTLQQARPEPRTRPSSGRSAVLAGAIAAVVALAVAGLAAGRVLPAVSPLLWGLAFGVLIANLPRRRGVAQTGSGPGPAARAAEVGRTMLRLGIVGLGLQISLGQVVALGPVGAVVVGLTVTLTFWSTRRLGRRLGLEPGLVTLVAAGFSICGAAAVAAVSEVTRPRQRDVALALALVTVFGTALMLVLPGAATLLGLTDHQAAIWAGASIHEVAQVVGAASLLGSGALAAATTVKLAGVALLAPVVALTCRDAEEDAEDPGTRPSVPWFVTAFLAAVVVRSTGLVPAPALALAALATTFLLTAGMVGLGLGIRLRDLWPLQGRVVLLAAAATGVAMLVPLAVMAIASALGR